MLYRNYQLNKTHGALKFGYAIDYPAILRNCRAARMRKLHAFGNTVQDGTPAPDNPVEIQGVGDRTENLLNNTWGKLVTNLDGSITTGPNYYSSIIDVTDLTTICISGDFSLLNSNTVRVGMCTEMPETGATALRKSITSNSTLTVADYNYAVLSFLPINSQVTIEDIEKSFMVNEGSIALPYEPYGYKIPMTVSGRNLLPMAILPKGSSNGVTVTINGDDVTVSGTTTGYPGFASQPLDLSPGDYYFYVNTTNDKWYRVRRTFDDNTYKDVFANSIFTITGDEKARVRIALMAAGNTIDETVNIAIYPVNTITDMFEPYYTPQTFPIYTDMPLYKIGNYADRIILALGAKTAMLERNIFITNSQDIQLNGKSRVAETNSFYYSVKKELANPEWAVNQIFNGANTSDELTDVICDMLPTLPIKMLYGHTDVTGICITKTSDNTACEIRLNLPTDIATTVDEANEYFHGLSCNIYRVLQTPVVIDISNKIDWNSIPKFWNGTVIISTNTTISPSNLEVKYIRR